MYRIRIKSRRISSLTLGNLVKGDERTVSKELAYQMQGAGVAEIIEGDDTGPGFETKETPPSSSPPGQARQAGNPVTSPVIPSSRSMTATGSTPAARPTTPRTTSGGKSTAARASKPAAPKRVTTPRTKTPPASSGSSTDASTSGKD